MSKFIDNVCNFALATTLISVSVAMVALLGLLGYMVFRAIFG